jgi:hypothetical protein
LPSFSPDPQQVENIRRTITLLNTSTPQHRNTVRILFYGQSISAQDWWLKVVRMIQSNYPHAQLIVENRAINGHSVDRLLSTAEADVYPFQPDLIIFHAYGSDSDHELFQQRLRERTCADVMWQNDHIAVWDGEPRPPVSPPTLPPNDPYWHSLVYVPHGAERYGACFVDVRTPWEAYLRTNHVSLTALLEDQVHLNADGQELLARIVQPYFLPRGGFVWPDPFDSYGVHTYTVGSEVRWINHALALPVQGSRVDVILGPGKAGKIEVEIDGRPPSSFSGAWTFTRTSSFGELGFPSLLRVRSDTRLQAEHWQLTVTQIARDSFSFAVHGSVTGDDGAGTNTALFRSHSGRVVIRPEDWSLRNPDVGDQVVWDAVALHADRFTVEAPADSRVETVITLAQNLPDAFHVLLLKSSSTDGPAIRAIRVYSPKERAAAVVRPPVLKMMPGRGGSIQLEWPAWLPGWQLEQGVSLRDGWNWVPVTTRPEILGQQLLLDVSDDVMLGEPMGLYRLRFGVD